MNYLYKIGFYVVLVIGIASCTDYTDLNYQVEKPVSVEQQEAINAYEALIAYAESDLMIGANVPLTTYTNQDVNYRLINSNFNEVTLTTGMNHGAVVQPDGSLTTVEAESLIELANNAGLSVHGQSLMASTGQNAEYLNGTIAPIVIPAADGPAWEEIVGDDFEGGSTNWTGWGGESTRGLSSDGEGHDGAGYAFTFMNPTAGDFWGAQVALELSALELDATYRLNFKMRADTPGAIRAEIQSSSDYSSDALGTFDVTEEWEEFSLETVVTMDDRDRVVISFGDYAGTVFMDDVSLEIQNENGGGGPTWDLLSGNDFETDDAANYQSSGDNAVLSFTADGEGASSQGRALIITNSEVRDNDWESQLFFTFSPATEVGQQLQLTMDVRADAEATMATQAQTTPGAYKHWDFFGAITATTEWTSIDVKINVSEETSECTAIAFNFGSAATNYYFDNIEVRWYNEDGGGEQIIEMTPEEKKDTLSLEMETWISGMMEVSKESVTSWDVVSGPMDDENSTDLKSGLDKELGSDEFYWQDYLGMDYAVTAFKLAKKYGNDGDKLFIVDNNLASNLDKCEGLIDYVAYIEEQGAVVDGIGVQMDISIATSKDNISQMFAMLAETGKLIRVSDLTVSLNGAEPTYELLVEQADMYKYVLDKFAEHVAIDKRSGVSVLGLFDTSETQGLWYSDLDRKPAYSSFADGLDGM